MQEEETRISQEIEKWSQEVIKTENERKDLAYKKDNLNYNQEKRELEGDIKESHRLELELADKLREIEQNQSELRLYKINELLFEKKEIEGKTEQNNAEKLRLVEALDMADIKLQAKELDKEIQQEWEKTQSIWQENESQYQGYTNYLSQEIESNNRVRKQYEDRVKHLQNEINKFEIKEDELGKDRRKLEEAGYDSLSLFYPERIVEDLTNDKAQLEDKIAQLSEQMKAYEGQRVALDIDINQLDYRREEKLKKVEELTQKAKKQEEVELSLARRVTKRLLVNYEGSLLNHDWFAQKLGSLEEMEQQKKESLEEIQKEIWEKSIDQVLNQEDYFIPNKDVALIKDGIKGLGIYVETGSEYLRGLDELEKANLLQEHPGFLYSVVIKSKQDWDLIKKNIRADLFLNNNGSYLYPLGDAIQGKWSL